MLNLRMPTNTIGGRIHSLRKLLGLTQEELGLKIGASRRMITYYERETTQPPVAVIVALSKEFGISSDVLLGLSIPTTFQHVVSPDRALKISQMNPKTRKQLFQIIDAFVDVDKSNG